MSNPTRYDAELQRCEVCGCDVAYRKEIICQDCGEGRVCIRCGRCEAYEGCDPVKLSRSGAQRIAEAPQ